VLRDTNALNAGSILFTAHDLHEAPWGLGEQLNQLIADGVVGDAVLLPEPLCDRLPVIGRGSATWKVFIRRKGPPVHEVMRPVGEPSVIAAGADLVSRLERLQERLSAKSDPLAGTETVFIGQMHSGEIYNSYAQECWLQGTRRWLPGGTRADVEQEFRTLLAYAARDTGTTIDCDFTFIRDAFLLDQREPLVTAFQEAYETVAGKRLPIGSKPFVDDGNSFYGLRRIAAITHGPRAGGQHTVSEWVSIDDLVRVALVYAATALSYCGNE
jgi:succinyl-diaminopimelate desuccinylase